MNSIEKHQSFFILASVVTGLFLGQISIIRSYVGFFIVPFLMVMLYGIFLQVPLGQLRNSFKNWKFARAPLISLTLVIGPLIELPVLGLISHVLLKIRKGWME